jgi:hypothetical protein
MIKNIRTKESLKILSNNYIGHLAFIYKNEPYVLPITYYYNSENHSIISYSGEGHKIEAMRKNNSVSLEVAEINTLNNWKSVLVQGTFEELQGLDAKYLLHQFALGVKDLILKKENKTPQFISEISSKIKPTSKPIVFRIIIDEITGKQRAF